ncbi:ROK family protein [Paenibacillus typhae]|uniref:ROK family protein n=1 Tax=Paenibacillus typhae TaxID=1174501 RepID=UPI001C8E9DF7|nr:ROK family protein [Paenibacillus typhae]MBY0013522.1 ROK family protein [Paenibacillus typhae]
MPITHNTAQVKKINVELVKNTLKAAGTGTKASIANMTRLSVATCGSILNELVRSGEVIELELEESSGGRPARQYMFNADYACVLCLMVKTEGGRHSITYLIVNLAGDQVEEGTRHFDHIDADTIHSLVGELAGIHRNVKAAGIGIPGVAHRGVIGICDVAALAGVPLGEQLSEKHNMDIIIENDMNATVYGFYQLQNLEEDQPFAVVTFPDNHFPGAGFIVNGRMVTGSTNFAGEISYSPLGLSREEQLERLHNKDTFVSVAAHMLASIITVLNPVSIAVTGDLTHPSMTEELLDGCRQYIPEEHLPALLIKNNTQEEYKTGLTALTLESLTYRLQLVERK